MTFRVVRAYLFVSLFTMAYGMFSPSMLRSVDNNLDSWSFDLQYIPNPTLVSWQSNYKRFDAQVEQAKKGRLKGLPRVYAQLVLLRILRLGVVLSTTLQVTAKGHVHVNETYRDSLRYLLAGGDQSAQQLITRLDQQQPLGYIAPETAYEPYSHQTPWTLNVLLEPDNLVTKFGTVPPTVRDWLAKVPAKGAFVLGVTNLTRFYRERLLNCHPSLRPVTNCPMALNCSCGIVKLHRALLTTETALAETLKLSTNSFNNLVAALADNQLKRCISTDRALAQLASLKPTSQQGIYGNPTLTDMTCAAYGEIRRGLDQLECTKHSLWELLKPSSPLKPTAAAILPATPYPCEDPVIRTEVRRLVWTRLVLTFLMRYSLTREALQKQVTAEVLPEIAPADMPTAVYRTFWLRGILDKPVPQRVKAIRDIPSGQLLAMFPQAWLERYAGKYLTTTPNEAAISSLCGHGALLPPLDNVQFNLVLIEPTHGDDATGEQQQTTVTELALLRAISDYKERAAST